MAVHNENILMTALHTLVVNGIDMGGTFEPLVLSAEIGIEDIGTESYLTPVDSEITSRLFSAEVTLAEVKLATLAVVMNLPVANIVSSSSMLTLDSGDRGMMTWLAVGRNGSAPGSGTRAFSFPQSRSVGTPTYNLAKLEATNVPVQFRFYANRTTGLAGTITDTATNFMLFDTARSNEIDLQGSVVIQSIYTAVNQLRVTLARVVYDEATSSHAGVEIRLGKIGNDSFFSTFTSEPNKAAGAVTSMTLTNTLLAVGETMTVHCNGLKTGTGVVTVQVELEAWT